MFDFIRKDEYFLWIQEFAALRENFSSATSNNLKDVQDHYALSKLSQFRGARILEVGGGDCRVLRAFAKSNECWNADKFVGMAFGPKRQIKTPGVRNVATYLGEFSQDLSENYFDAVFSISVVEHVVDDALAAFFQDIARVMKPRALMFHAIDLYIFDEVDWGNSFAQYSKRRVECYRSIPELTKGALSFRLPSPAQALNGPGPRFSCAYATNADREMLAWNKFAPKLAGIRSIAQSVSLAVECVKT